MLRMVIRPDGQQQILPSVPPYQLKAVNLCDQPAVTVDATLAAIRNELSHQVLPTDQWPLFDLRATQLAGQRTRLHISLDILLTDGLGLLILFREWFQLYHQPASGSGPCLALPLTFRDYVLAERQLQESDLYRQAEAYWLARLDTLPPAPRTAVAAHHETHFKPQFTRAAGPVAGSPVAAVETAHRPGQVNALWRAGGSLCRSVGAVEQTGTVYAQSHALQSPAAPSRGQYDCGRFHLIDLARNRPHAADRLSSPLPAPCNSSCGATSTSAISAGCACCANWRGGRDAPGRR